MRKPSADAQRPLHNQPLLWTGPRRVRVCYTPESSRASRCPPQIVIRYLAYPMRKFRVRLQGCNFLIPVAGIGESKHGFYSNRFVEAVDEAAAELAAVAELRAKQSLRDVVRNPASDPPRVFLDELAELKSFDGVKSMDQGLVWYPEVAQSVPAK